MSLRQLMMRGGGARGITFVGAVPGNTGNTLSLVEVAQPGDLAIIAGSVYSGSSKLPPGFAQMAAFGSVWYKICTGGEFNITSPNISINHVFTTLLYRPRGGNFALSYSNSIYDSATPVSPPAIAAPAVAIVSAESNGTANAWELGELPSKFSVIYNRAATAASLVAACILAPSEATGPILVRHFNWDIRPSGQTIGIFGVS